MWWCGTAEGKSLSHKWCTDAVQRICHVDLFRFGIHLFLTQMTPYHFLANRIHRVVHLIQVGVEVAWCGTRRGECRDSAERGKVRRRWQYDVSCGERAVLPWSSFRLSIWHVSVHFFFFRLSWSHFYNDSEAHPSSRLVPRSVSFFFFRSTGTTHTHTPIHRTRAVSNPNKI